MQDALVRQEQQESELEEKDSIISQKEQIVKELEESLLEQQNLAEQKAKEVV